jgi:hypothetical protein
MYLTLDVFMQECSASDSVLHRAFRISTPRRQRRGGGIVELNEDSAGNLIVKGTCSTLHDFLSGLIDRGY